MAVPPRAIVLTVFLAALALFAVVQDRITASGARRYVALERDALAGRGEPVTIDQVMGPAVERSVREGLVWGGAVLIAGLGAAAVSGRARRRRPTEAGHRE